MIAAVILSFFAACVPPRQRLARCLTPERIACVVTNAPSGVRIQIPESQTTEWSFGSRYSAADVVIYSNVVYCCVQSHTVYAENWTPPNVPALWRKLHSVGDNGIQEWVQPTGAHDCYSIGDKVKYNGKIYQSLINGNVWSPDVYPAGWKELK